MIESIVGATTLLSSLASLMLGVISTAIAFLVKEKLNKNKEYQELRQRLEKFAGKNALIVYRDEQYRIIDIFDNGIMLHGYYQKIFVPAKALTQSDIILPAENYDNLKANYMAWRQSLVMQQVMPQMMDQMFSQIFPRMQQALSESLVSDDSEVSVAFAMKLKKLLKDEGLQVKKNGHAN